MMEIINYSALDELQENEQLELVDESADNIHIVTLYYTREQPFIVDGGIQTISNTLGYTYSERGYKVLDLGLALSWIRNKTDMDIQQANN